MKKLFFSLLLLGFTIQVYAQITVLPEVAITVNYKYLDAVNSEDMAEGVKMLREEVAFYDLKDSELYKDEYDTYFVSFFIPEGKILAAYDKDGILIRTIEKFKNIKLPQDVLTAVANRFPEWGIAKDIYKVNYHHEKGATKEVFRIKLENGDKTVMVKIAPDGNFM
jgi:predicted nucleic acid-binding protein